MSVSKEEKKIDIKRYTIKKYVHLMADEIEKWDNPDAMFYLMNWIEDYLNDINYFENNEET